MKFTQLYTPGRTGADPYDWLADCFGAMAGVITVFLVSKWKSPVISALFELHRKDQYRLSKPGIQ